MNHTILPQAFNNPYEILFEHPYLYVVGEICISIFHIFSRQCQQLNMSFPGIMSYNKIAMLNGSIYSFGGFKKNYTYDNTIYFVNTLDASPSWQVLEPKTSIKPVARLHSSLVIRYDTASSQHQLVVYSGFDGTVRLNDLWVFGLESKVWTKISYNTCNLPPPRCAFAYGYWNQQDKLLVHGGFDGSSYYNDLWCFCFKTCMWHLVLENPKDKPMARSLHTASASDHSLLVVGGTNRDPINSDCLFQLHLRTTEWIIYPMPKHYSLKSVCEDLQGNAYILLKNSQILVVPLHYQTQKTQNKMFSLLQRHMLTDIIFDSL